MADYHQRWLEYRRLRNQVVFATLSIFPLALIFSLIGDLIPKAQFAMYLASALVVGWLGTAYITGARANVFLCPRCGEKFAQQWWYRGSVVFARRCAHCGLPKYANEEDPQVDLGGRGK